MNWLVNFVLGFLISRTAVSTSQTARNSARTAEKMLLTEAQKARARHLAGERRFRLHRLRGYDCRAVGHERADQPLSAGDFFNNQLLF
jgi:hypothetical protein